MHAEPTNCLIKARLSKRDIIPGRQVSVLKSHSSFGWQGGHSPITGSLGRAFSQRPLTQASTPGQSSFVLHPITNVFSINETVIGAIAGLVLVLDIKRLIWKYLAP